MRISELAHRSGVPARTVRFYADQRLIVPAARSDGGYRVFDERALRELRFVRRGQRLGLSLAEIKPLLKAAEQGEPSKLLRTKLTKQLDVVNERIASKGPGELPACPQAARNRSSSTAGRWKNGSSEIT